MMTSFLDLRRRALGAAAALGVLTAFVAVTLAATTPTPDASPAMVLVAGGTFRHSGSIFFGRNITVSDFYLGKFEVTQREWSELMDHNPSQFQGDSLPVERVSWFDCIDYCNRRSVREGLTPYYSIDRRNPDPRNGNPQDDVKWIVTTHPDADGYRLPTEAEWEYAATGGGHSRNRRYSGGDDLNAVGWYWQNAGDAVLSGSWHWPTLEANRNRTHPVGSLQPNELGLHDMAGNVREWCWDWLGEPATSGADPQGPVGGFVRVWKGGGWMGGDFCCEPAFRSGFEANGVGPDQGFRLCRTARPRAVTTPPPA